MKKNKRREHKKRKGNIGIIKILATISAIFIIIATPIAQINHGIGVCFVLGAIIWLLISNVIHELGHYLVAKYILKEDISHLRVGNSKAKVIWERVMANNAKFEIRMNFLYGGSVGVRKGFIKDEAVPIKPKLLFLRAGVYSNLLIFIIVLIIVAVILIITKMCLTTIGIELLFAYLLIIILQFVNLLPFKVGDVELDGYLIKTVKKNYRFKLKEEKSSKNKK